MLVGGKVIVRMSCACRRESDCVSELCLWEGK